MKSLILSLMAVLCCGSMFATNHPAPGKFGVTAEYLYFMPSIDDTYFVATNATSNPPLFDDVFPLVGTRVNNDFSFNSGYRLGAAYAFCSCERGVEVTYTHLNANQHKTVAGNFLTGTIGGSIFLLDGYIPDSIDTSFQNYQGTASSKLGAKYNRVDGLLTQNVFNCCNSEIYLLFGLEYAYLHLDEHYRFDNTAAPLLGVIHQTSHTWGIGPELGLEMDYALLECNQCLPGRLSFIVKSTASLLASETALSMYAATTDGEGDVNIFTDFNDKRTWRLIPAIHARFGLGYSACICRYDTFFEIGYEFNSYFRGFGRAYEASDNVQNIITEYNNYDLQGLYVSASASF